MFRFLLHLFFSSERGKDGARKLKARLTGRQERDSQGQQSRRRSVQEAWSHPRSCRGWCDKLRNAPALVRPSRKGAAPCDGVRPLRKTAADEKACMVPPNPAHTLSDKNFGKSSLPLNVVSLSYSL